MVSSPHIAGLLRLSGEATLHRSRARLNPELQSTPAQQRLIGDRKPATTTVRSPQQSEILLRIVEEATTLFHAPDGTAYGDIHANGHRETWNLRSPGFRRWLIGSFYRQTGGACRPHAMQQALAVAEAKALNDGPEHQVYVRVSAADGKIFIDLADANWRAIEVSANGWAVVERPPIRFVRSRGMLPLTAPVRGGTIEKLRDFINVKSDQDFVLIIAWILAALRGAGPYPVLTVTGEQGAAKSTLLLILRSLIDPNVAGLRSPPRDDRELFIAAGNSHMIALDNLNGLPRWLSDGLARIATGAAHATRQLYSDRDEVLLQAEKPVALNGITDIVDRADLADRCIFVTVERISDYDRKPRGEILTALQAERPRILGALLDAVVHGLKTFENVEAGDWPRMADFAKWATACEGAFELPGAFRLAYMRNRNEAVDGLLDDDLVAMAVRGLALPWEGTATALMNELNYVTSRAHIGLRDWPRDGKGLSRRLRQLAPLLRTKGIDVSKLSRTSTARGWKLTSMGAGGS